MGDWARTIAFMKPQIWIRKSSSLIHLKRIPALYILHSGVYICLYSRCTDNSGILRFRYPSYILYIFYIWNPAFLLRKMKAHWFLRPSDWCNRSRADPTAPLPTSSSAFYDVGWLSMPVQQHNWLDVLGTPCRLLLQRRHKNATLKTASTYSEPSIN